jgi:predicted transcriptional regulator
MKVSEFRDRFGLEMAAGKDGLNREIGDGYCGDLLSDVMANCPRNAVWLTIQSHHNIVAVALLREISAILLVNGRLPDEETRSKADEEGIPILVTPMQAYRMAGRIFEVGIGRETE